MHSNSRNTEDTCQQCKEMVHSEWILLPHGFENADLVVTGIIPIDLLAQERKQVSMRKAKVGKVEDTGEPGPIPWLSGRKDGPVTRRADGPVWS